MSPEFRLQADRRVNNFAERALKGHPLIRGSVKVNRAGGRPRLEFTIPWKEGVHERSQISQQSVERNVHFPYLTIGEAEQREIDKIMDALHALAPELEFTDHPTVTDYVRSYDWHLKEQ